MSPEHNSSNDLILEMMREVVEERRRDMADGLTLRSLQGMVRAHTDHDDRGFDAIEKRLRELENAAARSEGLATGRFNIPPLAPIAPMQIPPVVINARSHRPSMPWLASLVKPVTKQVVPYAIVAAMIAASHLLARCGVVVPPPPMPPPSTVSPAR
jgi:hypothetical protein